MRSLSIVFVLLFSVIGFGQSIPQQLDDVGVTIRAGQAEGSGVIVTRQSEGQTLNFVLTAGHVVDGLRTTRLVGNKTVVEFRDAQVVKQLVENGRNVGEMSLNAEVIKYSDIDHGDDIAVLLLRKRNFINTGIKFYLDDQIPSTGTELYHCGSMLGTTGSNSLTSGIISNVGRLIDDKEYDQYDGGAKAGSSGGILALKSDGRYVGMLTRGASDVFTLFTPIRRIRHWAEDEKMMWLLDETIAVPSLKEIEDIKVESSPKDNVLEAAKDVMPVSLQDDSGKVEFKLYNRPCVCGENCKCEDCQCEVK